MKEKLIKAIPEKEFTQWVKAANGLGGITKGNVSEYIRLAVNYCIKNKVKF